MNAEFERELKILQEEGLKNNPLRQEYERKVRELSSYRDALLGAGKPASEAARLLHEKRRELGRIYKDAAPPLFREYILYATEMKYGDPLGPDYESLCKRKTAEEIIESATRPIENLDNRLTFEGFIEWYRNNKMH
ncbi:MAG: hypothetical protein IJB73_09880 [Firmicutes bacterium]|nr:hypothetical protein [Bacillota bacterium]